MEMYNYVHIEKIDTEQRIKMLQYCTKVYCLCMGVKPATFRGCLQEAFGPQATVHLADANRASAWLLVESNQAIRHHGAVGRPRRRGVGEPVGPGRHLLTQRFGLASEAK